MGLVRLLYFCAAYHNINVCIVHVLGVHNKLADSLSCFQMDRFRKITPHANLVADNIPAWPMQSFLQCCYHGVASSIRRTYQSGINTFFSFCSHFRIPALPGYSLALQYFCVDILQSVLYKTLKVYLSGIRLLHIEHGLLNPTDNKLLQLHSLLWNLS